MHYDVHQVIPTQLFNINRFTHDATYDAQDTCVHRLNEEIEEMRQGREVDRTAMEAQREVDRAVMEATMEAQREADRAVMEAAMEAQREADRAVMEARHAANISAMEARMQAQMQAMREHIDRLISVVQVNKYIIKYIFL